MQSSKFPAIGAPQQTTPHPPGWGVGQPGAGNPRPKTIASNCAQAAASVRWALASVFSLSVPCHTYEIDTGDLAVRIEADEHCGRIAARENELYQVECLLTSCAAL